MNAAGESRSSSRMADSGSNKSGESGISSINTEDGGDESDGDEDGDGDEYDASRSRREPQDAKRDCRGGNAYLYTEDSGISSVWTVINGVRMVGGAPIEKISISIKDAEEEGYEDVIKKEHEHQHGREELLRSSDLWLRWIWTEEPRLQKVGNVVNKVRWEEFLVEDTARPRCSNNYSGSRKVRMAWYMQAVDVTVFTAPAMPAKVGQGELSPPERLPSHRPSRRTRRIRWGSPATYRLPPCKAPCGKRQVRVASLRDLGLVGEQADGEDKSSAPASRAGLAQNISLYMNKPLPPLPMTDHEHTKPLTGR